MSPTAPPPTENSVRALSWSDPVRQAQFTTWFAAITAKHALAAESLRIAASDAGFRRYFRVNRTSTPASSLIIMDAPPEREDSHAFVRVAALMDQAGLNVPAILEWDQAQGFMLLSDLGHQTLLESLQPAQAPPLNRYLQAVDCLIQWQLASREGVLPVYDRAMLLQEMELFPQWYVARHRSFTLDAVQRKTMDDAFAKIVASNLAWPSVFVHRDFMPRNLMVGDPVGSGDAADTGLGVLDFQDAVYGPIVYDIASLMRDAFVSWEEPFCLDVTIRYWEKARKAGLPVGDDFGEFYRGVEWMGLQRHLKIAGIFARLSLRDGKPRYLQDTPRFIAYIRSTCERYIELKPLLRLVERIEGIPVPNAYAFGRV